ncbi:MAG: L,D-transpeptidase family protein [Candidatus Saccharimonadales bacterium]
MKLTSLSILLAVIVMAVGTNAAVASPAFQPVKLHNGSQGQVVTELQQFLHDNQRADFYADGLDGNFGPLTKTALIRWQKSEGTSPTGTITVGSVLWNQLRHEATVSRLADYISQAAIQAATLSGWAVDASKSPAIVSVLRYDKASRQVVVALSIEAAFAGNIGGMQYTTYDGVFHIYADFGPDFVSKEYNNAPMPYAACFNGGQCLHYDGLFPSHGCIHIPSWNAAIYINRLPLGTTVVVHK